MAKVIALLTFVITLASTSVHAQSPDADSVMQVVLNALTTKEHTIHGNLDSLLTTGSWEALAYWETHTPETIESLQQAVGDRYQFDGDRFTIQFINPENSREVGLTVNGNYRRVQYTVELYKGNNGPVQTFEIWYIDPHYLVIEFDGLRVFLTQEKSYYLLD